MGYAGKKGGRPVEMRYARNLPALTEKEQALLRTRRVLIAGCGGLGGYLAEYLARLGVGEITAVDGDRFDETNLNRQLCSTMETIGQKKVLALRDRAMKIRPDMRFEAMDAYLTADNAPALIRGQDAVLDALDSRESRLMLEDACAQAGAPLVHGAVRGWTVQAAVSLPGSGLLHRLYGERQQEKAAGQDAEAFPSPAAETCLSFTPALCAAIQAAEAVKLLCGREPSLAGKAFTLDLQTMESWTFPM